MNWFLGAFKRRSAMALFLMIMFGFIMMTGLIVIFAGFTLFGFLFDPDDGFRFFCIGMGGFIIFGIYYRSLQKKIKVLEDD